MRTHSSLYRLLFLPGILSLSFSTPMAAGQKHTGATQSGRTATAVAAPFGETPDWAVEGESVSSFLGYAVASAGDINGDFSDDVIISTIPVAGSSTGKGRLYVYTGSEAAGLNTVPIWMYEAQNVKSFLGFRMCSAGDVNGDGFGDILVNEPRFLNGQVFESRAYVFFGSAGGLGEEPGWTVSAPADNGLGWVLTGAGDLNNDGFSDIAVGESGSAAEFGKVHIFYGSATGLHGTPDLTLSSGDKSSLFGADIASVGDVNTDGYDDFLVGEPGYKQSTGRVMLFLGGPAGLDVVPVWTAEGKNAGDSFGQSIGAAGDINNDRSTDIFVRSMHVEDGKPDLSVEVFYGAQGSMATTASWSSRSTHEKFERIAFSSAGDVNRDGFGDILVGGRPTGGTDVALLYYGTLQGLETMPAVQMSDGQDSSLFATNLASAGDVNNDGFSDIIIGVPGYDNHQKDAGRAVVYYGGARTTGVDEHTAQMQYASLAGNVLAGDAPLALDVELPGEGVLYAEVVSVPGTVLVQHSVRVDAGAQRVYLSLPNTLSSGMYFVRLTADGKTIALPFSIVR